MSRKKAHLLWLFLVVSCSGHPTGGGDPTTVGPPSGVRGGVAAAHHPKAPYVDPIQSRRHRRRFR
jgi:hypothetical protein